MSAESALAKLWYGRPGVLAALLTPFSWLFAAIIAVRRAAYRAGVLRAHRASVPVVVVGNLSVGGTGKSPLVAWLVLRLRERGVRAGILSRGYGARIDGALRVEPDTDPRAAGDEAVMLAQLTQAPVVVAPRRAAGVALLEAAGVDLIVCDDGLQHLALARDLEIVVIDAQRGFGNGRLLPAGPLRELPSRLATVDFVVVQGARVDATGTDVPRAWQGWHGTFGMQLTLQAAQPLRTDTRAASINESSARPLAEFVGARVHAVAGIGNPTRFFAALRAAGLAPIEHPFPDHHVFRATDLEFGDTAPVLMTAKDAVKCRAFADARCWQVPAAAQVEPDDGCALLDHVAMLVRRSHPA